MINKHKLKQATDLQEFLTLESDMLMSWMEYQAHLKCLRLSAREQRLSDDKEELDFYLGLIKGLKNEMCEQLKWLDSEERYQLMESLTHSDFVKSIFRMKGDK